MIRINEHAEADVPTPATGKLWLFFDNGALFAKNDAGDVFPLGPVALTEAVDDAAAASAGVPIHGLYENAGAVRVRKT